MASGDDIPSRVHAAAGLATLDADFPIATRMPQIEFQLDRDHVELNQLLKLAGLCDSGGAGKALVASGAVRVDGVVELRKTCKIRAGQRVEVGDVDIQSSPRPDPRRACRRLRAKVAASLRERGRA